MAPAGQNAVAVEYAAPYATPGATVSSVPSSGSVFAAGENVVNVSMAYGTNSMNCQFSITVLTTDDLGIALNTTNGSWSTAGAAPWFVEKAVARDMAAAKHDRRTGPSP